MDQTTVELLLSIWSKWEKNRITIPLITQLCKNRDYLKNQCHANYALNMHGISIFKN